MAAEQSHKSHLKVSRPNQLETQSTSSPGMSQQDKVQNIRMLSDINKAAPTNNEDASSIMSKQSVGFGKSFRLRATRRSLSGAPLTTYLFETKFQHLKAFQKNNREARGMNFLLAPTSGALYRSSMPVTPIATPLFGQGLKFTEQSLHNRILQSNQAPPRRAIYHAFDQPDISESPESQTAPAVSNSDSIAGRTVAQASSSSCPPERMDVDSSQSKTKKEGVAASSNKGTNRNSREGSNELEKGSAHKSKDTTAPEPEAKSQRLQRRRNR